MKSALFGLILLLLGPLVLAKPGLLDQVREEHADKLQQNGLAALVADADEVRLFGDLDKEKKTVVVKDRSRIRDVGIALTCLNPATKPVHCLCIGYRVAEFYRQGGRVARLSAIHGNQLRIDSVGLRGDYPVSEEGWRAVRDALVALEK